MTSGDKLTLHTMLGNYPNTVALKNGKLHSDLVDFDFAEVKVANNLFKQIGDVFTRALANELQKAWGQPVVVENRSGGGQNIGARACAEAPPDGYTLCVLSSEAVIYNQFLFKSIPYNPETDFEPI